MSILNIYFMPNKLHYVQPCPADLVVAGFQFQW